MILPKKKDRWRELMHALAIARDVGNMQESKVLDPLELAKLRGKCECLTYVLQLMDELGHE